MNHSPAVLVIHPSDNVAVALEPLDVGRTIEAAGGKITVRSNIPLGHKLAIATLREGECAVKYGQPIGMTRADIAPGEHVHVHNLKSRLEGLEEYHYVPPTQQNANALHVADPRRTFQGFLRPTGEVGIRNELWILPTVGCVNETAQALARGFRERFAFGTDRNSIDGVFAFTHPYGCSQLGDDHDNTQKILAGLSQHPNAGGVLIVGLGCENNQVQSLRKRIGDAEPQRYRYLVAQEAGDEHAAGLGLLAELAEYAGQSTRRAVPSAKLRVGLKCGGSDGLSGITANFLIGRVCDELVALGAAAALTEVPEMFGAEPLFMNRCRDRQVFDRCVMLVNDFKDYFIRHGHAVYENPAPGNISGGITTLEEKSLGCLQKGGTSAVVDVLPYGGRLQRSGLNFISGPGNDIVSTTLLAAAGVHLILFSTGRGTPLGSPVPTIKISSNSPLAAKKPNWIDFDAGRMLSGVPVADLTDNLLELVLQTAGGAQTKNEQNGFREIAIFKDGVTL
jgi:altronate hydrolase